MNPIDHLVSVITDKDNAICKLNDDYKALQRKFDTFVKDQGSTVVACESCGHAMRPSKVCLHCENERLRKALEEACSCFEPDNLTMQSKLKEWKRIAKSSGPGE